MSKQREKYLTKLSRTERDRLEQAIQKLIVGSFDMIDIKPLIGFTDLYRCRVGDWRIIFKKTSDSIEILKIKPRGNVY